MNILHTILYAIGIAVVVGSTVAFVVVKLSSKK